MPDVPFLALDNVKDVILAAIVFMGTPLSIAAARLIWKRSGGTPSADGELRHMSHRIDEVQRSIDSMAVEIERIAEGQRYTSKLLTERDKTALPGG
jgi:hypothetical protein